MVTNPKRYRRIGGRPCLDFANSLDGARGGEAHECLNSYADLVEWARQAEVVTAAGAKALLREADARPGAARAVLRRAIALREAIYDAVVAAAVGRRPQLETINAELQRGMGRARLRATRDGVAWGWPAVADELDGLLGPLARCAADLLASPDVRRVHACAGDGCTWLFLDTTRNHRRRWCEMKTCGNLAKVRAFRRRKKPTRR